MSKDQNHSDSSREAGKRSETIIGTETTSVTRRDLAGRAINGASASGPIQWVDPMLLKNDPELDRLWPLEALSGPSEEAFIDDVAERGVLDPLKVSPDGRFVWDGRRRLRAARRFPDRVKTVPVMRCRDEDKQWVILFGITLPRVMSPSGRVYIGYPWWSEMLEGSRENRVKNLRKGLSTPIRQICRIGNITLTELAQKLGINPKLFGQCQQVLKLFAEHPEAKTQWEPKILSGKASFWNVISGRAGEESTRKHVGLTPAEFRGRSLHQCFGVLKTFARRLKDFESLSGQDKREMQVTLAKNLMSGKRAMSRQQLEAVANVMDDQAKMLRKLAEQAEEGK